MWLSLGSFPEPCPNDQTRHYQTHYIINNEGNQVAKYRKMHMFDAELATMGGVDVKESAHVKEGSTFTTPCFSPVGYLGLSVSYDIRFPELYRNLVLNGAQVMIVPSAFLAKTGATHWETLLRARAIEN